MAEVMSMITVRELQPDGSTKDVELPVDRFVIRDNRRWSNEFTEVIGSRLHYFESVDKVDLNVCTAKDIADLHDGWVHRYRNDPMFNAKVNSIVASLMQVVDV